jgi:hypothetical protein
MRLILLCLLALPLGGCFLQDATTAATTPVGAQAVADARNTVYALKSLYAVALEGAVLYDNQKFCSAAAAPPRPFCKDQPVVIKIAQLQAGAKVAIDSAERVVLSGTATTSEMTAAITAAQAAYGAFQTIVTNKGASS